MVGCGENLLAACMSMRSCKFFDVGLGIHIFDSHVLHVYIYTQLIFDSLHH